MESGRGVDERDGEGELGGGSQVVVLSCGVGWVVVAAVVVVVKLVKVVRRRPSSPDVTAAAVGTRSYSYPVVTVPPCEGVCGSLYPPLSGCPGRRAGCQCGYSLIVVSVVLVLNVSVNVQDSRK